MSKPGFRQKKIKYEGKDGEQALFEEIKRKKNLYFSVNHLRKCGNAKLLAKALMLLSIAAAAYCFILLSADYAGVQCAYIFFGLSLLLAGINFGHDAAHHCLTGDKKKDGLIFEWTFGIQGLNGYLWKIRHNHSHHPFPNVYEYDSDLEMTALLFLNPRQPKKKMHYYQHIYAPLLYMLFSLMWICYIDFVKFRKTSYANLHSMRHPAREWVKLIGFKLIYFVFFLVVPMLVSQAPAMFVAASFLGMHFLLSFLLSLTFFISHHVAELSYVLPQNEKIRTSWVEQQITSTMDFHAESKLANFIFGGFNAHLAHHLFPDVCHIHYPALTSLIKKTLREKNVAYHSLTYAQAIRSHFRLLKRLPRRQSN